VAWHSQSRDSADAYVPLNIAWIWAAQGFSRIIAKIAENSKTTNIPTLPLKIKECSRHSTVPLCCLPRGDAAISACQARGYLHVAVAYGAQAGRTKKREATTRAPTLFSGKIFVRAAGLTVCVTIRRIGIEAAQFGPAV